MKTILQVTLYLFCMTTMGQAPSIQWQHTYGGPFYNQATTVLLNTQGGYIVGGAWYGSHCVAGAGSMNGVVLELNADGNINWHSCLEYPGFDETIAIQSLPGGGYIALSVTDYNAYDFILDPHIMKLSESGTVEWSHLLPDFYAFGILNYDYYPGYPANAAIKTTTDGGYLLFGNKGNDFFEKPYATNCSVTKLNSLGVVQWETIIGGTNEEVVSSAQSTQDGNFIFAGSTNSNNGIFSDNHGLLDFLVVKINDAGGMIWKKCLGGSGNEMANDLLATSDGGFMVAGYTSSNDGNVFGNHGGEDAWIIKLNGTGTIVWQKCLGGTGSDRATSIQVTLDGGYIVLGYTYSTDGDVSGNHGGYDVWMVKLDATGEILWQKCLGGSLNDFGNSVKTTPDGGYIFAGETYSSDGDVTFLNGTSNMWIVKLNAEALGSSDFNGSKVSFYPNPVNDFLYFTEELQNVNVYTINSQKIHQATNVASMDLSRLSSGMYFLKTEKNDGTVVVSKIIKQ